MPPSRHSCDELMSRSLHDACDGDGDDSDYVIVDDFCQARVRMYRNWIPPKKLSRVPVHKILEVSKSDIGIAIT